MNIFVPFPDTLSNARMLDDLRLNKMILESTQIMCTVLNGLGCNTPYKSTHIHSPCTLWAGLTRDNFLYLHDLACEMIEEKELRGFKNGHACSPVVELCGSLENKVNGGALTPFVNCTTNNKDIINVHQAYQAEMILKWESDKKQPKWTKRGPPEFYVNYKAV